MARCVRLVDEALTQHLEMLLELRPSTCPHHLIPQQHLSELLPHLEPAYYIHWKTQPEVPRVTSRGRHEAAHSLLSLVNLKNKIVTL